MAGDMKLGGVKFVYYFLSARTPSPDSNISTTSTSSCSELRLPAHCGNGYRGCARRGHERTPGGSRGAPAPVPRSLLHLCSALRFAAVSS